MNKFLVIFWRVALIFFVILIFAGAINKKVAFSGRLELSQAAGQKSAYFSQILPDERASEVKKDEKGRFYKEAWAEPLYIDLKMPRNFDDLELEMLYQNDSVAQVALGVQVGPENQYDLKPIQNKNLDRIMANSFNWQKIESNGVFFFQRRSVTPQFSSFEHFLQNLPEVSQKTATHNYSLRHFFRLKDYQSSSNELVIDRTIRGPHQILTYLKNEPLEFSFKIQDINRRDGADAVEILVYKDDQVIDSESLKDDGLISSLDPASAPRFVNFSLPNLPEGVYRIELKANDDIFIREIRTRQSKIAFLNRLYLADNKEYHDAFPELRTDPVALYTNGTRLKALTAHEEGLQKIEIWGHQLEVNQTHQNFVIRKPNLAVSAAPSMALALKLISPKNDLQLETNGLFAFSQDQFFNPNFISMDSDLGDLDGIDYVVANYDQPKVVNDLKVASVSFDLSKAYKKDQKIRLIISAPEISQTDSLKIYQIKAILEGRAISFSDLKDKFFKDNDSR